MDIQEQMVQDVAGETIGDLVAKILTDQVSPYVKQSYPSLPAVEITFADDEEGMGFDVRFPQEEGHDPKEILLAKGHVLLWVRRMLEQMELSEEFYELVVVALID